MKIHEIIAQELKVQPDQAEAAIALLDEGNTVPFIARYRKEKTGGLDDEILRKLADRLLALRNLSQRREDILRLVEEQGKLTDDFSQAVAKATTMTELDDLYRPYRPKKRTRATMALERGLGPLAEAIKEGKIPPEAAAQDYLSDEVPDVAQALAGASDILAEGFSEDAAYRQWIRFFVMETGQLTSSGEGDNSPYEMYFDFSEALKKLPGHRILAINRGEKEGVLKVSMEVDFDRIHRHKALRISYLNDRNEAFVLDALKDAIKRLIWPSVEREIRNLLTEKAEEGAIDIFSKNLEALLLQPPVKGKRIMGFDPGFRTGCKVAILDENGKYLESTAVFPTVPRKDVAGTKATLKALIKKHQVEIISLGNGTASRESEQVISELIQDLAREGVDVKYVITSEAGASVYSASELASREYPDLDVTVRGAISIGRRLQDPLAELVKIDPKSIGVGQYQHDIDQKRLAQSLAGVVEACVNRVGVDLNTATPSLLTYVAGINKTLAENIVAYRDEANGFKARAELKKVKRLGQKAFEQCAGFLRVPESEELLDQTAVHPESYATAKALLKILGYQAKKREFEDLQQKAVAYGFEKLSQETGAGVPTLKDIVQELLKPGRDPREDLPKPQLKSGVLEMKDLAEGMVLTGTVRNVSDFGAFVDIGVHQDGLVHISQLADRFVKHPMEVVRVGDVVEVKVISLDLNRKRIGLSMKGLN